MNKSDLVDAVAQDGDMSKASAARAVDSVLANVGDSLGKGESVSLVGFGTFSVRHRAAREGRNPQTGASMHIAASKVPGFKAGKGLKDKVKNS
ncbi:HU family DNA-binding protein [Gammaproteobacteria bacterium]|nr:HU family DNA-binding protein [Gammaproteobacteria bacterium]